MRNDIEAIFIDSEGTLKNANNQITLETKQCIQKLQDGGVYVVITTGLPRFIARRIALSANASSYVIASNGADIYDLKENSLMKGTCITSLIVRDILKIFSNQNIILGIGDKEYCNCINDYSKNGIIFNSFSEIDSNNFFQCHISQKDNISCYDEVMQEINDFILKYGFDILSSLIGDEIRNSFIDNQKYIFANPKMLSIIMRAIRFIKLRDLREQLLNKYCKDIKIGNQSADFTKFHIVGEIPWFSLNQSTVSKGEGIKNFCQIMGIDLKNTMGVGNDYNDLSMIEQVSLFACPRDAHRLVKEKSSLTFDRAEHDISYVLQKVYKGGL